MDRHKIQEVLLKLGTSPDQVAESLKNQGCLGSPYSDEYCPVAKYLRKETQSYVSVSTRHAYFEPTFSDKGIPLPSAVAGFVVWFDAGIFPDLVE